MSYELNTRMMTSFIALLSDEGLLQADGYDIAVKSELKSKFKCRIKRPTLTQRNIIIEYPASMESDMLFFRITEYLFDYYNVSLVKYASSNGISLPAVHTLFSILHELGHAVDYVNQLSHGGDLIDRDQMIELSKYWEVSKITNLDQRFIAYRQLPREASADKIALELMDKYRDELINILMGGIE